MDLVHMQQDIDGETQHMNVHPGAVAEWESSGWVADAPAESEASTAEGETAPPAKTVTPARARVAADTQEV